MGRLRDLEAENAALQEKVAFYESWLKGETAHSDSAELKKLRRELTAARGAASALEAELKGLHQRFEAMLEATGHDLQEARQDLEAARKIQESLKRDREAACAEAAAFQEEALQWKARAREAGQTAQEQGRHLAELAEAHARLARRADKGARRWHPLYRSDCKRPKDGEYVLICAFFMAETMEQIAEKRPRVISQFLIRDAFYREKRGGGFEFDGIPDGYLVMAWQPLVEPDWNEIQKGAMQGLKYWSEDEEGRRRELAIARKRGGRSAEDRLKRLQDSVKAVLSKSAYRPARDRQGKDLIFLKGPAHKED